MESHNQVSDNINMTTNLSNDESVQTLHEKQTDEVCLQQHADATCNMNFQHDIEMNDLNNIEEVTCNENLQHDIEMNNLINNVVATSSNNMQPKDNEMENLMCKTPAKTPMIQMKLIDFLGKPNDSQKRNTIKANKRKNSDASNIVSAPSKKRTSISKVKLQPFDFITAKTKLFPDKSTNDMENKKAKETTPLFNFGESSKSTQQHPKSPTTVNNSGDAIVDKTSQSQQYPRCRPPPIVINGGSLEDIKRTAREINKQPNSFSYIIMKDKRATKKVTVNSWEDYEKLIQKLKDKQYQFHTYSKKVEPQMKFVLYGLPVMETTQLNEALKAVNITPAKIVRMTMKRKRHNDDQNYLLYFQCGFHKGEQNDFLKTLTNVKFVDECRVRWAKYESKRNGPSQCSRCLQFGHGERGCYKFPICFRCSEQHESKSCIHISKEVNKVPAEKLKCHFCGEQHTAVNQKCNVRIQIIEKWTKKSNKESSSKQKKSTQHLLQSAVFQQKSGVSTHKTSATKSVQPSRISTPFVLNNQHTSEQKAQKPISNCEPSTSTKHQQKKKKKKNQKAKRHNSDGNTKQQPTTTVEHNVISHPSTHVEKVHTIEPSTSDLIVKETSTTSCNEVPIISIEENSIESTRSKFLELVNEMLKLIQINPDLMILLQQTIGSAAKDVNNNHGL